jgi:hypothetical protein
MVMVDRFTYGCNTFYKNITNILLIISDIFFSIVDRL